MLSHVHAANGLGRLQLSAPRTDVPPWSQGYVWARELRDQLNLQDRRFIAFDDLLGALSRERPSVVEVEGAGAFDALAVRGGEDRLSVGSAFPTWSSSTSSRTTTWSTASCAERLQRAQPDSLGACPCRELPTGSDL